MHKRLVLTVLMAVFFFLTLQAFAAQDFTTEFKAAADDSTALSVIDKYLKLAEEVEDFRLLQGYWQKLDAAGCNNYFYDLLQKQPKSELYIYLWARIQADPAVQIKYGRYLVQYHPRFEYGYRLLLTTYQKELFSTPGPEHDSAKPWLKDYKKDRKYFARFLKYFPDLDTASYLNIGMLVWEGKVDDANKLLAEAQAANASWLNWQFYTSYYLQTDQILLLQAYLRRMIDNSSLTQNLSAEDKEQQFEQAYLTTLLVGEAYQYFFDFINTNPATLDNANIQTMYLLACAQNGMNGQAFILLDKIADNSGSLYSWLLNDQGLEALRQDERWEAIMARFKRGWEAEQDTRKADVIATRFSRPAPLWALQDAAGNTVRLEDLRGEIVILDFWATWCEPCQKAMPVLDRWMKTKMPQGVRVFSVNVWEEDKAGVLPFMTENGYSMTLLYGTDNLSTDYGFDGIPYICVIDKLGNIRYEERGFTNDLGENLSFWVEDLLR